MSFSTSTICVVTATRPEPTQGLVKQKLGSPLLLDFPRTQVSPVAHPGHRVCQGLFVTLQPLRQSCMFTQ